MIISTVRSSRSRKSGLTLLEVLISLSLFGVVSAISIGSLLFLAKSTQGISNYQVMNLSSRFALDRFASDARMTADVSAASKTSVTIDVYNSSGGLDRVTYAFDSDANAFTRTVGGVTEVLLEDVEHLELGYFTLRRVATLSPIEIKEIQIYAVMKKSVLSISNTNEIISARYMMRNRSVSS